MAKSESLRGLRHVELRWYFVLDETRARRFALVHIPSGDNLADMLTKALGSTEFARQARRIMSRCAP